MRVCSSTTMTAAGRTVGDDTGVALCPTPKPSSMKEPRLESPFDAGAEAEPTEMGRPDTVMAEEPGVRI